MKKTLAAATAILCTVMPSPGFIKMEQKSTLNKDGSARFTTMMEIDLAGPMAMLGQAGAESPLGDGREILVKMMQSMGNTVDVWSDAKAEKTQGGATRVTLSGYTKDWRAMTDLKKAAGAAGQSSPLPLDSLPEIKFMDMKNDASGNTVITMAGIDELGQVLNAARKTMIKNGMQPKPGSMAVDEAEIAGAMAQARSQWPGFKGIAGAFIKGLSLKSEIEVSGTITSSSVFEKTGENTASFTFNGTQLINLADKLIFDQKLPGKIVSVIKSVESNFENEESTSAVLSLIEPYLKEVYGGDAQPKIVIKPGADAFDYAAETASAQSAQSRALKSLIEEAKKAGGKAKLPGSSAPAPKPGAP